MQSEQKVAGLEEEIGQLRFMDEIKTIDNERKTSESAKNGTATVLLGRLVKMGVTLLIMRCNQWMLDLDFMKSPLDFELFTTLLSSTPHRAVMKLLYLSVNKPSMISKRLQGEITLMWRPC
eukprot:sb/3476128/